MIKSRTYQGAFFMALAMFLFALCNVIVKEEGARLPASQMLCIRSFFGALVLGGIFVMLKKPHLFKSTMWGLQTLQGLAYCIGLIFFFQSLILLPFSQATVLSFMVVPMVTLLSKPVLKQHVSFKQWSMIAMGFVGVVLIAEADVHIMLTGLVCALLAALFQSINFVISPFLTKSHNPWTPVFYIFVLSCIGSMPAMAWDNWVTPSLVECGYMGLLGLLALLGGYAIVKSYSLGSASTMSSVMYSQVLWGILFGMILWGEMPTDLFYIGTALIIGSGIYALRLEHKQVTHGSHKL